LLVVDSSPAYKVRRIIEKARRGAPAQPPRLTDRLADGAGRWLLPSGGLAYPVLVDPSGTAAASYGLVYQGSIVSLGHRPATFIIDRDGILQFEYHVLQENEERPTADEIPELLDGRTENRPSVEALRDGDARVRRLAVEAIWRLGNLDDVVVPALIQALEDPDASVRSWAVAALKRAQPSALPLLFDALSSESEQVRSGAAEAICLFDHRTRGMGAALCAALLHRDPRARAQAASTLARLHASEEARSVIPRLISALGDREAAVRRDAADSLWRVDGWLWEPSVAPALIGRLGDPDLDVRERAAWGVLRISTAGHDLQKALPDLFEAMAREDPPLRDYIAEAVGRIGPAVLPRLVEALKDKRPRLRAGVAYALYELGRMAAPAIPALRAALGDEDASVRKAAADALARIEPPGTRAP